MTGRILVVDDEPNIIKSIQMILGGAGFDVEGAASGEQGLVKLGAGAFDAVFLDYNLPGMDGLEVLKRARADRPGLPVIMVSGEATIQIAVEATQLGAVYFMEKPFSRERVLGATRDALEVHRLRQENLRLKGDPLGGIRGQSPAMLKLREEVERVGPTEARVLIRGESGTGKELVARALHDLSQRATGPFIKLNCAAIAHELIESELFGAVKGAYTGATASRDGRFAAADGGTLFLDEIGDMAPETQARILRVLAEGEVYRIGGHQAHPADVRVISATNRDLDAMLEAGTFRADLFHRISDWVVELPPLRYRRADIPNLAAHFLGRACSGRGVQAAGISRAAVAALVAHDWPGNVRQLEKEMGRAALFIEDSELLDTSRLQPGIAAAGPAADGNDLKAALERAEKDHIERVLAECAGDVNVAAERLGVGVSTLYRRMRTLSIR